MEKELNPIVEQKMSDFLSSLPSERREEVKLILNKITSNQTDTGVVVSLFDLDSPEDNAMLQSLNSRSSGGMFVNLKKVLQKGSADFMEMFYVNYGDKSIGDCGTITFYIDGLSMIAAKQFQNWPLYNGQETSTRYVAMTKLGCYDPIDNSASKAVIDILMDFYEQGLRIMPPYLKERFPIGEKPEDKTDKEWEAQYEKAINAKMFDILGAFLPAGARTNASIHMNLRQIDEQQKLLVHNPSSEVRAIAYSILSVLKEKFPATYIKKKKYPEQDAYWEMCARDLCYFVPEGDWPEFEMTDTIDRIGLANYQKYIDARPVKTELPKVMGKLGSVHIKTFLDYRSFRDIQRQRNGITEVPLLVTNHGFEEWYFDQLPDSLFVKAKYVIERVESIISSMNRNEYPEVDFQYLIPMGFKVPVEFSRNLVSEVFVQELRTGLAVHPTVRNMEKKCAEYMMREFPDLKLHVDMSDSEWDMKRGLHDIVEKK